MPNILDIPMKKTANLSISSKTAHAIFKARKAHIEITSELNKGVQINSRYKSEQTSIGINDNYLASVTYRKRTFPIYIIFGSLLTLVGFILLVSADPGYDQGMMITGIIILVSGLVSITLYFYTRIARISFRLADEQDYDILLSSSAVQDSNLMQMFIQKMLMNAMKVEENIETISFEDQLQIPKTEVHDYQPPAVTQPIAEAQVATQPMAQQQVATQPMAQQQVATQPIAQQQVATQPVEQQQVATQPSIQQDVNWGQ
jgi:hypothetical protein